MTRHEQTDRFYIDKKLVRESFQRAAKSYDKAAVLQHEIGRRMQERLELIRISPELVLDIGAGTGNNTIALGKRYRHAAVLAVDFAPAMLQLARQRVPVLQKIARRNMFLCADTEKLPLKDNSADMIFSNLTLQWCNSLDNAFSEFFRILKPGGLLMFSTFGPDTLKELRSSWKNVDNHNHVNAFIDMHDIGDAMIRSRLATPVIDVENVTMTYPDIRKLMHDLKSIGAHNVTAGRAPGLTGKTRLKKLAEAYEQYRSNGTLPATYEVVYGHAWAPINKHLPQTRQADGTIAVPLSQLRHRDSE